MTIRYQKLDMVIICGVWYTALNFCLADGYQQRSVEHTKLENGEILIIIIYYKCKKHSLSHQLTAQLHIENSKNKKW